MCCSGSYITQLYFFLCSSGISRTHSMSHLFFSLQPLHPPCSPFSSPCWLMLLYFVHVGTSSTNTICPLFCLENFQSPLKILFHLFIHSENILSPSCMSHTMLDLWHRELSARKILSAHPLLHAACWKRTYRRDALHTSFSPLGNGKNPFVIFSELYFILLFAYTFWNSIFLALPKNLVIFFVINFWLMLFCPDINFSLTRSFNLIIFFWIAQSPLWFLWRFVDSNINKNACRYLLGACLFPLFARLHWPISPSLPPISFPSPALLPSAWVCMGVCVSVCLSPLSILS